jgi:hypothetical protein
VESVQSVSNERWTVAVVAGATGCVAGAVLAWVGWWGLGSLGPFDDDVLLGASIMYFPVLLAGVAAVGAGTGLIAAGSVVARPRLILLGLGVVFASIVVGLGAMGFASRERAFEASEFREAARNGDFETLEAQAYRAVESKALIGWSKARVRREMGPPGRTGPRRRLWIWDVGMINDFLGPGDGGALYVQFDERGRVRRAQVSEAFE